MRIFLDSSVLLAACGQAAGASRAVCDLAASQGWRLLASQYVWREVEKNVRGLLPPAAWSEWTRLQTLLERTPDLLTFAWPAVFPATKDRPVLFSAAATADVLLTLDRRDFGGVMRAGFYGLAVMKPGDFLLRERAAGRLR